VLNQYKAAYRRSCLGLDGKAGAACCAVTTEKADPSHHSQKTRTGPDKSGRATEAWRDELAAAKQSVEHGRAVPTSDNAKSKSPPSQNEGGGPAGAACCAATTEKADQSLLMRATHLVLSFGITVTYFAGVQAAVARVLARRRIISFAKSSRVKVHWNGAADFS
jgi:hypothetical protein